MSEIWMTLRGTLWGMQWVTLCCLLSVSCVDEPATVPLCFDRSVELKQRLTELSEAESDEELKAIDDAQLQALLVDRELSCVSPGDQRVCHELYLSSFEGDTDELKEARRAPWRFAINLLPLTDVVSVCDLPEDAGDCYTQRDCQAHQECVGFSTLTEGLMRARNFKDLICEGRDSCSRCLTRCDADERCSEEEYCYEYRVCVPKNTTD